jgi:mannose-6-phosphate isomerase-like protein (cupin superfamily)
MPLQTTSLVQVSNQLLQPFQLRPLASLGHLIVIVYVCQGEMEWHRHPDEDELFLVHEGVITLDTERGSLNLHAEELAVIPKGVAHRSLSTLRSVVVLIRPGVLPERTNGHRRYRTDEDPPLEKVRLAPILATAAAPFRPVALAQVEDFEVLGMSGRGAGPELTAPETGAFWLVVRGGARVETGDGQGASLAAGDLALLPAEVSYRLTCSEPALLLTLARAEH